MDWGHLAHGPATLSSRDLQPLRLIRWQRNRGEPIQLGSNLRVRKWTPGFAFEIRQEVFERRHANHNETVGVGPARQIAVGPFSYLRKGSVDPPIVMELYRGTVSM